MTEISGREKYSRKIRARALRLYGEKDWSAERISKLDGMPSVKTIQRWVADAGIERKARRKYPRAQIKKMLDNDVPRSVIRAKYGCSHKYLSDLAKGKITP
jgi:hypothetical protein